LARRKCIQTVVADERVLIPRPAGRRGVVHRDFLAGVSAADLRLRVLGRDEIRGGDG